MYNSIQDEIKLTYADDKDNFIDMKFNFKLPSAKVKVILNVIQEKTLAEANKIDVKYKDATAKIKSLMENYDGNDTSLQMAMSNDFDLIKKQNAMLNETVLMNFKKYCEEFKAIVKTNKLSEAELKLFNSDVTQDFWQSVNFETVKGAVDFFTSLLQKIMINAT